MNNFSLEDFLTANRLIHEVREVLRRQREQRVSSLEPGMGNKLHTAELQLKELGLYAATEVENSLKLVKNKDALCESALYHLDAAIQFIDEQIKSEWTYHYGVQTSNIEDYEYRWQGVLQAFPNAEFEIASALDCFALQHYTASVFHFMRTAEHGLKALAAELSVALPKGKPLTHANWQEIITHCDKQVKYVGQNAPAGEAKDRALAFYTSALAQLHYLKDNFRNDVMHAKARYNRNQAAKASLGTKQFMEGLSVKLSEKLPKKGFKDGKIDWGY